MGRGRESGWRRGEVIRDREGRGEQAAGRKMKSKGDGERERESGRRACRCRGDPWDPPHTGDRRPGPAYPLCGGFHGSPLQQGNSFERHLEEGFNGASCWGDLLRPALFSAKLGRTSKLWVLPEPLEPVVHLFLCAALKLRAPLSVHSAKTRTTPLPLPTPATSARLRRRPISLSFPLSVALLLMPSDANNGGGFSVPRFCADSIFPHINFNANTPVQNISVHDVHGTKWEFRHIYRVVEWGALCGDSSGKINSQWWCWAVEDGRGRGREKGEEGEREKQRSDGFWAGAGGGREGEGERGRERKREMGKRDGGCPRRAREIGRRRGIGDGGIRPLGSGLAREHSAIPTNPPT
ncbi:auxin response factor 17-like protein [Cinnamomum micranthum f. kanehirae]|uniref:Auxin response factor 17-like protein n=1 Tax=Cinnamomum micranthum f. kanehirae TaxID=337451 RepID=A0A3S4P8Q3_9MAGN|nr:auxin response factor 17-like protein [Cinnamomum micranthum f. kanehirae]